MAKVVITEQRDNSTHVQTTVNKMRILLKNKNSRHVIYSVKITAFHCNFDLYFMYTKHLIDMHEVSFPLADITYILSYSKLLNHTNCGTWIGGRGKTLTCHHCGPGSNTGVGMWQDSGRPKSVVFSGNSGFLHHLRPQDANILAFKIVFRSSMSFLCNRSKINNF